MLYDPKWEKPSLAGFKRWLEQQYPDETFNYRDCDRCAVGQYLASIGTTWSQADAHIVGNLDYYACRATNNALRHHSAQVTFGAVLREMT
jgi:hypothetical protein